MKKLIFFFLICLQQLHGKSQTSFYDALKIRNNFVDATTSPFTFKNDPASINEICNLLRNYLPDSIRNKMSLNETQVLTQYLSNPFLKFQAANAIGGAGVSLTSFSSAISSIGNLDVTNLADGFAKFLVERTKEELNIAFFEKFRDVIGKPEYKDVHTLFPQTYATLEVIGDRIYNYSAYINTLRESFEKDLQGLLTNLPKVINDGRYKDFFNSNPQLKAISLSAIYIGKSLKEKVHPGDIIADYDAALLDDVSKDVKGSVQTLQVFSNSLRSQNTDHYWIDFDSLKLLVNDPIVLKIYLGLIWQQSGDIAFEKTTLRKVLEFYPENETKFLEVVTYIKGFIKEADILRSDIQNVTGKDKDKLTFTDYYNYYNDALDMIEYATNITQLPVIKDNITLSPKFQNYIRIARAGGDLALDISRRNYSSAIINTYSIYNFAFGGDSLKLKQLSTDTAASSEERSMASSLITDRAQIKDGVIEKVKKFLLQYGPFVAAVSQAENSDEVKQAIESVALPSGSSRIKRESKYNVALNAYVGLFGGHEFIKGVDNGAAINTFGIAAPIGVSFSVGGIKKNETKGGKSWSALISLVDLGAVTAYRFTNDSTTDKLPTIQLKDIVSPGLFISYGLGKCPISINGGFQYGPLLRKVSADANTTSNSYWRASLSVCVDIPVLNFYTKSR